MLRVRRCEFSTPGPLFADRRETTDILALGGCAVLRYNRLDAKDNRVAPSISSDQIQGKREIVSLIHTLTILICLAALFSYVNHRLLKLPITIGLMAVALVFSLVLLGLGKLGFGIEAEAQRFIRAIDFNEALMHGM